jgi:pimeloyl-ACP methyl ester carboxylesterase
VTATLEGAGVELAYDERGDGPPVVLVHGTAGTRAGWDSTRAALGQGFRTIAYDRRGCGQSGTPEDYRATTVPEHADDLAAVIRGLDAAPALLCAQSFGAVTAVDLMLREPDLVRAAVLVEPAMLWMARVHGAEEASATREAMQEGAQRAGAAGAIDAFLVHLGGDAVLDLIGPDELARAHATPRSFAAEVAAVGNWSAPPRELRALDVPAIVVLGSESAPAWVEACETLAGMLPRAELRRLGRRHWPHLDDPAGVAAAVRDLAA